MKIILCCYNKIGYRILEKLLKFETNLFVYTHKSSNHLPSIPNLCQEHNIKYSFDDISRSNLPFVPELILSIYYRYIFSEEIIKICNNKIMNLHPSILPAYKGCSSVPWAIINDEEETGITYHYINKNIDEGPVIIQKKILIEPKDTQLSLYNKLMNLGYDLFDEAFDLLVNGYPGEKQIGKQSYYKRGFPFDGMIDDRWDDDFIKRFIRAAYFPPLPGAKYNNKTISSFEEYIYLKEKSK